MDDPRAVALELGAVGVTRFRVTPSGARARWPPRTGARDGRFLAFHLLAALAHGKGEDGIRAEGGTDVLLRLFEGRMAGHVLPPLLPSGPRSSKSSADGIRSARELAPRAITPGVARGAGAFGLCHTPLQQRREDPVRGASHTPASRSRSAAGAAASPLAHPVPAIQENVARKRHQHRRDDHVKHRLPTQVLIHDQPARVPQQQAERPDPGPARGGWSGRAACGISDEHGRIAQPGRAQDPRSTPAARTAQTRNSAPARSSMGNDQTMRSVVTGSKTCAFALLNWNCSRCPVSRWSTDAWLRQMTVWLPVCR